MTRQTPVGRKTISAPLRLTAICALIISSALAATTLSAASMRCGSRLLSDGKVPGPTMPEVLQRCGEPYLEHQNQWLYVRGDAVYRVYFNANGELSRIKHEIAR